MNGQSLQEETGPVRGNILDVLSGLPPLPESIGSYRDGLVRVLAMEDLEERCSALVKLASLVPKSEEFLPLFTEVVEAALDAASSIGRLNHRKSAVLRVAGEIPDEGPHVSLFAKAMTLAIGISDKLEDRVARRSALIEIADRLYRREELRELSRLAFEVSLGLAEGEYRKFSLKAIAKELPKSCDYAFYRKHTFFGIAMRLKREGRFPDLYKQAISLSIRSAAEIPEPFYRQYGLLFIANELPKDEEFEGLYREALSAALDAVIAIADPFTKLHALLELFRIFPKNGVYAPLILKTVEETLPFFSLKSIVSDTETMDVVDFIIMAEERKMTESKRRRYTRAKYGELFAAEIDRCREALSDVRLMEAIRPYTHRWIRPIALRDSLKKLLDHLTVLKERHHGREVERPILVGKGYADYRRPAAEAKGAASASQTVAIDLGATNTVVMKRDGTAEPEFLDLGAVSETRDGVSFVPTRIEPGAASIGAEAREGRASRYLKKNLLQGMQKDEALMEAYLRALCRKIRGALSKGGLFSALSGRQAEKIYLTVPVGFAEYRELLLKIMKGAAKGANVEMIEEPLAAAIGYQVAGKEEKLVLLFDFGGCTLDVMLMRLSTAGIHVIAKPDRSRMIGGGDIDLWLAEYLAKKGGLSVDDPSLQAEAERIKIALSDRLSVPFDREGRRVCEVSRDDLEKVLESHDFYKLLDREISYILGRGRTVGVDAAMIDAVLLTGGSSLIPSFREKIEHRFPELRARNAVYDHSPLTAVARGAALYGTREVTDRHLGMACALRYHAKEKEHAYEILFEKGETLPFEKTFLLRPAGVLGPQDELYLELFEVPDRFIRRQWATEQGTEFIRQTLKKGDEALALKAMRIVAVPLPGEKKTEYKITFLIDESGRLKVRCGEGGEEIDAGIRLQ